MFRICCAFYTRIFHFRQAFLADRSTSFRHDHPIQDVQFVTRYNNRSYAYYALRYSPDRGGV